MEIIKCSHNILENSFLSEYSRGLFLKLSRSPSQGRALIADPLGRTSTAHHCEGLDSLSDVPTVYLAEFLITY